jgi:intracellular protein transport protein USO1
MIVTPYVPVPETNGEEWDRLESASALDNLVELILHGEYNGVLGLKRTRDSVELRGAALGVFQVGS